MSCLTPGPAFVITRIVPGTPPLRGEPSPTPARPLTISRRLSASHQIVRFNASSSSRVRKSWARSQISGGSVTCASQSKVAKSFFIGAKRWTGISASLTWDAHRQRPDAMDEIGVDPPRRPHHLDDRKAREDLLPQDAQLQFGEPVADAAVNTEPERE